MKYICAYCKTEVKWEDMFCPHCGKDIFRRKRVVWKYAKYSPIIYTIYTIIFLILIIVYILFKFI